MNKTKKLFYLLLLFSSVSMGQSTEIGRGIQWSTNLSWEQVKQKAKQENKYIFLDCFATWCGPCKRMDRDVYANDTVGSFFNERFIAVKVQMDKTKSDNMNVQNWYSDAMALSNTYRIMAYPCFMFFSPQGNLVHMEKGYQSVSEFIALAKIATAPGKVYNDPFANYDRLIADYRLGIKHYDSMPYMIKTAFRLGNKELGKQLLNDHTDYAAGLELDKRYTKENIELWSGFLLNSSGKRFRFFYRDAKFINKVMDTKGYAENVVNRTIQNELVNPFFLTQSTGDVMKTAGKMRIMTTSASGQIQESEKADYTDADWKALYNMIHKKYNRSYAKINVIDAKLAWYQQHNNWNSYAEIYIQKLKLNNTIDYSINNRSWDIFLHVTDKKMLSELIPWMSKVLQKYPKDPGAVDTYASILYKSGHAQQGIEWEQKAMAMENNNLKKDRYKNVIMQMEKGEPIWGATWE